MCWLEKCFTSSKKKLIYWRKFSWDKNFKNFVSIKSNFIFYEVLFSRIMGWKQFFRRKIGFTLNTELADASSWIFTIAIVKINICSCVSLKISINVWRIIVSQVFPTSWLLSGGQQRKQKLYFETKKSKIIFQVWKKILRKQKNLYPGINLTMFFSGIYFCSSVPADEVT